MNIGILLTAILIYGIVHPPMLTLYAGRTPDQMIKFGEDVERELKTQVIQAREIKPGVFEARITEDTLKLENMPYNPNAVTEDGTPRPETCCQDNAQTKGNIS